MKPAVLLGLAAGAVIVTGLLAHYGLTEVGRALATLGWSGFAAIVAVHALLIAAMGFGWWLLGSDRADSTLGGYIWGRLIRDSASEALPVSQIGGYVLGARALALTGVSGRFTAAATVVDITIELFGQLAYTLVGLLLLAVLKPGAPLLLPLFVATVVLCAAALVFMKLQARGAGLLERAAAGAARRVLNLRLTASGGLSQDIRSIYRRRAAVIAALGVHTATWVGGGLEAWLTLLLMGVPWGNWHGLAAALVIDSLLYALRSFAFMIPNAIGVQEGGYVMLGLLFGLSPQISLALSLARRGRDLVLGIPPLLIWQAIEGKRAWRDLHVFRAEPPITPVPRR